MPPHESAEQSLSVGTRLVHAGRPDAEPGQPLNTPIVAASSFHAGGEIEYAREGSPTASALEAALGDLEHGEAITFSSGMAAANAVLDDLPAGAVVVGPDIAYSGVAGRLRELAAAGRIELRTVAATDTAAITHACAGAALLWLESPTNPLLDVADLDTCLGHARSTGVTSVVDNTFATPLVQAPLDLGADVVMHSVTKTLAGHSDLVMGGLVAADPGRAQAFRVRRALLGASPSAFDCFLALRGLRTLALRFERAQENAREIAARLGSHKAVSRVRYPGFGSIAAIEFVGGVDAAEALCRQVRVWTFATSLGGVESLLERRRRWPAESPLVPDDLVRLSFGIEDVDDLWRDLDAALR